MTVKRFLCVLLVVLLLVVPVSADYDSYYELSPVVSSPELFSSGASLSAVDSGISTLDLTSGESQQLADIRNALVVGYSNATSSSILGRLGSLLINSNLIVSDVDSIRTALTSNAQSSILGYLYDISYNTDTLRTFVSDIAPFTNQQLQSINNALTNTTDGIKPVVNVIASRLRDILTGVTGIKVDTGNISNYSYQMVQPYSFNIGHFADSDWVVDGTFTLPQGSWLLNYLALNLGYDVTLEATRDRTLFSRIKQMQQVLASDDDLALANSQKENREEIEVSFLSGSSGSTSLGKSDFGALSDVGGTVKETISLNGQSSVSDFTSGLAGADEAGQGWFSESTRSTLDTVSSSASYGLRDDPYNMSGWQDRYAWLEGEE